MAEKDPLPPKLDELVRGVKHWLAVFSEPILKLENYEWETNDAEQFYNFLIRSVIRRQYEAMTATVDMTRRGYGHFAVTLLRPAYEEMIWLEYLNKHPVLSKELVVLLMRKDLCENLEAQNEYLSSRHMATLGFTQRYIKQVLAHNRPHLTRLREIGRTLKWRDGALLPPFGFVARAVGHDKEYKYLYQGTSRFVHFSVHENMRRVWGKKGKVTIASSNFAGYWSAFALSWGSRIFFRTLLRMDGVLDDFGMSEEDEKAFSRWIEELVHVPIITSDELRPWDQGSTYVQPTQAS